MIFSSLSVYEGTLVQCWHLLQILFPEGLLVTQRAAVEIVQGYVG